MLEDHELLRRYAAEGSEAAFAELVQRRLNLVYSVALRQVGGDSHLAEDVTQKVFVDLARKAAELAERPVLTGWLYRSAQYAASNLVRSERRRRAREQETQTMQEMTSLPEKSVDWEKLRPVLDQAMGELDDDDRDAVALRFFEERPFAEVGRTLGLNEDAARKRVERALDKLYGLLARRGLTSVTTAALAVALANQAGIAAPTGMAASVAATAVASGAALGGAAAGGAGIFVLMSSTKVIIGTAGVVAALSVGSALYSAKQLSETRAELATANEHARTTEARLAIEKKNTAAAEADSAELSKIIDSMRASSPPPRSTPVVAASENQPITREGVEARYNEAREAARSGNNAAALAGFLWCFDEGMPKVPSYVGVRASFLLGELAKLGKVYPPALVALRERRDRVEARMADPADSEAARDFAALNNALDENARTLEVYDKLPPDDPRRAALLARTYDLLINLQRYTDAAQARSFSQMLTHFDMITRPRPLSSNFPNPERVQEASRRVGAAATAKNIEVLAGAGDIANARALIDKLLAYDSSEETQTLLKTHLARAGRPELFPPAK
jgi:RNA polymerase sigma factor (sigma-70 family)